MRPPVTHIKHTHVPYRRDYFHKGVFEMRLWWSPGGVLGQQSMSPLLTTQSNNRASIQRQPCTFFTYKNTFTLMAVIRSQQLVISLFRSRICSLTDDDVLEDVRVVVRRGCHYGTVMINSIRVQNYF